MRRIDGSGKPEGIAIYVDGKKQPTTTNTNNLQPTADITTETPLRIGQRSDSAVFEGSVQDFQLLIMDESLANVDERTREKIIMKIKEKT